MSEEKQSRFPGMKWVVESYRAGAIGCTLQLLSLAATAVVVYGGIACIAVACSPVVHAWRMLSLLHPIHGLVLAAVFWGLVIAGGLSIVVFLENRRAFRRRQREEARLATPPPATAAQSPNYTSLPAEPSIRPPGVSADLVRFWWKMAGQNVRIERRWFRVLPPTERGLELREVNESGSATRCEDEVVPWEYVCRVPLGPLRAMWPLVDRVGGEYDRGWVTDPDE